MQQPTDEPLQQAIRDATNGGYPLTSDAFKSAVIEPLGWKTAPKKPGPHVESPKAKYAYEFGL